MTGKITKRSITAALAIAIGLSSCEVDPLNLQSDSTSQESPEMTSSVPFPWWIVPLVRVRVRFRKGHNDVIDGEYYECIRDGMCKLDIGTGSDEGTNSGVGDENQGIDVYCQFVDQHLEIGIPTEYFETSLDPSDGNLGETLSVLQNVQLDSEFRTLFGIPQDYQIPVGTFSISEPVESPEFGGIRIVSFN